ncbi:uncharacterized [Tachysurus ichikawai]
MREDFTTKRHSFSSSLMAPNKIPAGDEKQIERTELTCCGKRSRKWSSEATQAGGEGNSEEQRDYGMDGLF